MSSLNRSASLSYHERSDSIASPISGSSNQLNVCTGAQYVSDFSVRALTDLQFVKVRPGVLGCGAGGPRVGRQPGKQQQGALASVQR